MEERNNHFGIFEKQLDSLIKLKRKIQSVFDFLQSVSQAGTLIPVNKGTLFKDSKGFQRKEKDSTLEILRKYLYNAFCFWRSYVIQEAISVRPPLNCIVQYNEEPVSLRKWKKKQQTNRAIKGGQI